MAQSSVSTPARPGKSNLGYYPGCHVGTCSGPSRPLAIERFYERREREDDAHRVPAIKPSFVNAVARLVPDQAVGFERLMRKAVVVVVLAVSVFQAAAAQVVRHSSIPESYRGSWAPGAEPCKEPDQSAIVLSANTFLSPKASCAFGSVSEIPGPNGPVYSTRLQCFNRADRARKKTGSNLIVRPDSMNHISVGPEFSSLKIYQRCPA
jgi:hypothetical protein